MSKKSIKEIVSAELSGFLQEHGFELYHIEYSKEAKDWYLRVFIDRLDGSYISTEDCEVVSRYLGQRLDELDPIEQNYYLEVSSPGLDRPLLLPDHFKKYIGKEIDLTCYQPIDGKKSFTARLTDFQDHKVILALEGKTIELMMEQIAKARLTIDF